MLTFLSRCSRQRERLSAPMLSICLFVCLSVAKMQKTLLSQKLSNLEPWSLFTTYRKSYMGFSKTHIGPLKSKMAKIRHLENRHDVIFFCWGWSDLDKISQTGAEWHVNCGDMVKIETRCRIPIWQTFGRIPWHVIPEPHITLQGAATWWIHYYDSRATCHIAGCSHLVKSNVVIVPRCRL